MRGCLENGIKYAEVIKETLTKNVKDNKDVEKQVQIILASYKH